MGRSVVAGKLMTANLPVFLAGGLSSAIGAAILVPVLFLREGGIPAAGKKDLLMLFLQAFTGIFLFRVLLLWGLLFTSAAEGGVITSEVMRNPRCGPRRKPPLRRWTNREP